MQMKIELRYDWSEDAEDVNLERVDMINVKKEISSMVSKGCNTKNLKSKMKKLNSLNATIL